MPKDPRSPDSIVSDSRHLDNQTDQWAIVKRRIAVSRRAMSGAAVDPLSLSGDRGAGSPAHEPTHPRQRARHRRLAATSLLSPTGTAPGHPPGPIADV